MSETSEVTSPLLAALCKTYPGSLFYRRNVGAMKKGNSFVRFGLVGQADIAGILNGLAIEIETKIGKNGQSKEQKLWQAAVERAGGIYILAYSVKDGLEAIHSQINI